MIYRVLVPDNFVNKTGHLCHSWLAGQFLLLLLVALLVYLFVVVDVVVVVVVVVFSLSLYHFDSLQLFCNY